MFIFFLLKGNAADCQLISKLNGTISYQGYVFYEIAKNSYQSVKTLFKSKFSGIKSDNITTNSSDTTNERKCNFKYLYGIIPISSEAKLSNSTFSKDQPIFKSIYNMTVTFISNICSKISNKIQQMKANKNLNQAELTEDNETQVISENKTEIEENVPIKEQNKDAKEPTEVKNEKEDIHVEIKEAPTTQPTSEKEAKNKKETISDEI